MEKIMRLPGNMAEMEAFCQELEALREDGEDVRVEMTAEQALMHGKTVYLSEMVQAYGYEQGKTMFFNTLLICPTDATCSQDELMALAAEYECALEKEGDGVRVQITEQTDLDEMNALIALFAEGAGGMAPEVTSNEEFEGLSVVNE